MSPAELSPVLGPRPEVWPLSVGFLKNYTLPDDWPVENYNPAEVFFQLSRQKAVVASCHPDIMNACDMSKECRLRFWECFLEIKPGSESPVNPWKQFPGVYLGNFV